MATHGASGLTSRVLAAALKRTPHTYIFNSFCVSIFPLGKFPEVKFLGQEADKYYNFIIVSHAQHGRPSRYTFGCGKLIGSWAEVAGGTQTHPGAVDLQCGARSGCGWSGGELTC